MKRGAWLAAGAFLAAWLPLTLWQGLAAGRAFRIGPQGQDARGPLIEGVIQAGAVMFVPALFAALIVFVLWAWRQERAERQRR